MLRAEEYKSARNKQIQALNSALSELHSVVAHKTALLMRTPTRSIGKLIPFGCLVGLEIFKAGESKSVFLGVALCRFIGGYQCFG
jgi:hypothetical protein